MRNPFRRTPTQEERTIMPEQTPTDPNPFDQTSHNPDQGVVSTEGDTFASEPEPEEPARLDPDDPATYADLGPVGVDMYNRRPGPDDGSAVFRSATGHNSDPEE